MRVRCLGENKRVDEFTPAGANIVPTHRDLPGRLIAFTIL